MKTKRQSKNHSKSSKPRGKIYRAKEMPPITVTVSLEETKASIPSRNTYVQPVKLGDVIPPETKAKLEKRADIDDWVDQRAIERKELEGKQAPETEAEANASMEKLVAESTDCATRSSFPVNPGETMEESIIRAGCDPAKVLANSEARANADKWVENWSKLSSETAELDTPEIEEPQRLTLCSRARMAYETEQRIAQTARHKWVVDTFGAGSWEGITHNESDDTYTICGYTWSVSSVANDIQWLSCVDKVQDANGQIQPLVALARDLAKLGSAIQSLERQIAWVKGIPKVPSDMDEVTSASKAPRAPTFWSKLWDLLNTPIV